MSFSHTDDGFPPSHNNDSHDGVHDNPAPAEPYTAFTIIPRAAPGTTCCSISTLLHQPNVTLSVTSANKVADGLTAGSFYAYTIQVGVSFMCPHYSSDPVPLGS